LQAWFTGTNYDSFLKQMKVSASHSNKS
jgi:hypothetical protein